MIVRRTCLVFFAGIALLMSFSSMTSAQIKFPKEFNLVPGDAGVGEDKYSTGRYTFDRNRIFVEEEYKPNNAHVKAYLSHYFGFPFFTTKDGLYWGTGKNKGLYSYIVITSEGENIELYSQYNDSGFSYYSKWLLNTIRAYKKEGKAAYFPLRPDKK